MEEEKEMIDMMVKMAAKNIRKPGRSVPENKECGDEKGEQ